MVVTNLMDEVTAVATMALVEVTRKMHGLLPSK